MAYGGGCFLPNEDVTVSGNWTFNGTVAGTGATSNTVTATTAAFTSQTNYLLSKVTLTPTTTVTATSGMNAIRGEINLTSGKSMSGTSFFTGVYGRGNIFGTVDIGSGDLAAVYAKFDLNGSTLTSGHIAPLQSNIVNPGATAAATTDLIYAESASGTSIKSILSGYATAAYAFDLTDVSNAFISLTGTCTTPGQAHGWIRVLLNGSVRYIALSAAVS